MHLSKHVDVVKVRLQCFLFLDESEHVIAVCFRHVVSHLLALLQHLRRVLVSFKTKHNSSNAVRRELVSLNITKCGTFEKNSPPLTEYMGVTIEKC